jgi:hypothetical protein
MAWASCFARGVDHFLELEPSSLRLDAVVDKALKKH